MLPEPEPASTVNVLPEPARTNARPEPEPAPTTNALPEPEPAPTTNVLPEPARTNALPEPEPAPTTNVLPDPTPTNALPEPEPASTNVLRMPEPKPAVEDAMHHISDVREPVDPNTVTGTPVATAPQPRRSTRCRVAPRKPDEESQSVSKRSHTRATDSDAGEPAPASKKQRYVCMLYCEETADCTTAD